MVPQGRNLSELKITEEDHLCLVRRSITSYTRLTATEPDQQLVKCILIGGPETGKTSWMQGFCREGFPEKYQPTTGVKFKVFPMQSEDGSRLKVQLWDTAGNLPVSNAFYRGASGFIVFFSLQCRQTLNTAICMLAEAIRCYPECCRCICLVATHADIPDPDVTEEQAERLANQKGWPFFAIPNKSEPFDAPLFALLDLVMMNQDEQASHS